MLTYITVLIILYDRVREPLVDGLVLLVRSGFVEELRLGSIWDCIMKTRPQHLVDIMRVEIHNGAIRDAPGDRTRHSSSRIRRPESRQVGYCILRPSSDQYPASTAR